MTRRIAFLRQARSDFAAFDHLVRQPRLAIPQCHPLHYLQMAAEKLAKAVLDAAGALNDPYSHVAFSQMPYRLARADVARAIGFRNMRAYRRFLKRTTGIFREVDEQVMSGRFGSAEEVMEEALLRMMDTAGDLDEATLAAIDESEEQIEHGQVHDWKTVSAELRRLYLKK